MTLHIRSKDWKFLRPRCPYRCIVYKNEQLVKGQNKEPETIKEHCGSVVSICIRLINDEVFSLAKGTHLDVCIAYDISTHYVKDVGWRLDNGNVIWR